MPKRRQTRSWGGEWLEARHLMTQIADLDRDGDMDAYLQGVWFENANGQGDFERHEVAANVNFMSHADLDSDGDADLITWPMAWYENDGQGQFAKQTIPSVGMSNASRFKFTDVGNDGRLDVVVFGSQQLALLRNTDGRGSFSVELIQATNVADAGDVDNDGDLDLLILENSLGEGRVSVDRNMGGSFTREFLFENQPRQGEDDVYKTDAVQWEDVDGDRKLDLMLHNTEISYFLNYGQRLTWVPMAQATQVLEAGTLVQSACAFGMSGTYGTFRVTDMDDDGDVDSWCFGGAMFEGDWAASVKNDGRGQFAAASNISGPEPLGFELTFTDVGDLNGDGNPDYLSSRFALGQPVWVDGATSRVHEAAPKDHGSSRADATPLTVPSTTPGVLSVRRENDWMQFSVQAGKAYDIRLQFTETPFAGGEQTNLLLVDALGTTLQETRATSKGLARLVFHANTTGMVYPVVTCNDCTGAYRLTVTELGQGEELRGDVAGDANLDGLFDTTDLIQIFAFGQFEDAMEDNSDWWTGDWDGDGDFTTQDLVLAMQTGAFERPAAVRPAAVAAKELASDDAESVGSSDEPIDWRAALGGWLDAFLVRGHLARRSGLER